ncbi:MAG TPA: Ldh family oxidoreductase [Alphaproteobacteria bacterium]|nr:Ldh family oxidoreductase [Alphaproteobacteria bacterium]
MPTVAHDRLQTIAEALLVGAGASEEEAEIVARHCIGANLAGHDSHGIIAIPTYIDRIKKGHIIPGASYEVERESATHMVVNGNWGFGYVVTDRTVRKLIEKAKTSNVAAATVYQQSHIGRLANYPLICAQHDMIGLITADSGRSPKAVAPFGGREARLGTNPISMAVPSDLEAPLFLDMATSAAAAGKVAVAVARGEPVPEGWVIGADGHPTTDPKQLRQGGALLPLGGPDGGYKGTGLAVMVEILCGLLTGLGYGVEPTGKHNDGCFIAVFNVAAFRDLKEFKAEVADFARYLKETPPAAGSQGVLYPGEIEYQKEQARRQDGVEIEDATWAKLQELADEFGMKAKLGM